MTISGPELISTDNPHLDRLLGGGVPMPSLVLVVGATGTMKSTLVYRILYGNSKRRNSKSLYISIDSRREDLLELMQSLGMGDRTIVSNIHLIDIGKLRKRSDINKGREWLEIFKRFIISLKSNFAFEFLAIDSMTALRFIVGFEAYRGELFDFFEWLRDLEVVVFVISKVEEGVTRICDYDEDLLVDGVIRLSREPTDDAGLNFERRLQCIKMRGLNNALSKIPFHFADGQFQLNADTSNKK